MVVTVRLDEELEQALVAAAKREGVSKSELVRRCLREYLDFGALRGDSRLAWELGKEVFGKYRSGRSDLSERHEEILREELHAKQRNRRLGSPDRAVRRRRPAS